MRACHKGLVLQFPQPPGEKTFGWMMASSYTEDGNTCHRSTIMHHYSITTLMYHGPEVNTTL